MPFPQPRVLRRLAETLAIGAAGGAALGMSGFPAGWMSGSIVTVTLCAIAGRPMLFPNRLAMVVFVAIGMTLGAAVTPETLEHMAVAAEHGGARGLDDDPHGVGRRLSALCPWVGHPVGTVCRCARRTCPDDRAGDAMRRRRAVDRDGSVGPGAAADRNHADRTCELCRHRDAVASGRALCPARCPRRARGSGCRQHPCGRRVLPGARSGRPDRRSDDRFRACCTAAGSCM